MQNTHGEQKTTHGRAHNKADAEAGVLDTLQNNILQSVTAEVITIRVNEIVAQEK